MSLTHPYVKNCSQKVTHPQAKTERQVLQLSGLEHMHPTPTGEHANVLCLHYTLSLQTTSEVCQSLRVLS